MADIKVPGVGPLDKKKVLIGGAIGAVLIAVVIIMRRRSAAASAPAAPATTADTSGSAYTDPNLDPATGFDYGTPQDQAALDSGGYYGGGGIGNTLGNIDPATGYIFGSAQDVAALQQLYGTGAAPPPGPKPQSETQWVSNAANALNSDAGVGRAAAAEALTEWIAGQSVTAQQAQYVREALALVGDPPNGAPPIHEKSTHPGGQPHPKVRVPDVQGQQYGAAREALADAGLKARAVPRAAGMVASQAPRPGTEAARGSTVTLHMAATG